MSPEFVSVLVEDYVTYNLQLSDVWSVRGSTAVFKCSINPYFVKDYIHVVGWSKGTKSILAGALTVKAFVQNEQNVILSNLSESRFCCCSD